MLGQERERNLAKELEIRDRDIQKQEEDRRFSHAKYNTSYREKDLDMIGIKPKYLCRKNLENKNKRCTIGVRALVRLRCGNMEEYNKYWLEEKRRVCVFCKKGRDQLSHFIEECEVASGWFKDLGKNKNERTERIRNDELDRVKKEILSKFWREKKRLEIIRKAEYSRNEGE